MRRSPRYFPRVARPLRRWLAWRFAWAGILPFLLVALLLVAVLLPQVHVDIERRHHILARAISGEVKAHLFSASRELSALAAYLNQRPAQPAPFWFDLLDAHAGRGEVFAAITIADTNDSVFAVGLPEGARARRRDLVGLDLSRLATVREARRSGGVMWSEVFLSTVSARLAVSLTLPVGDRLLIGEVAIDALSELLRNLPSESGTMIMLFDRRGEVIARSQTNDEASSFNLGHLVNVANTAQEKPVSREIELDGTVFIGTAMRVPPLDWIVLVTQPRSAAYQPLAATIWVLAIGGGLALLLAASSTALVAAAFARRIRRYTEQAHAIADGHYEQQWPISRIAEFDSLASDLDRMSGAIRHREQDLASSEARYRSVINTAPVAIFQFDADGVFSLSDGKALELIGMRSGQAVGLSLYELYRDHPEICACARRAIAGETLHFLARFGETVFETYLTPVCTVDHDAVQVMGVAVDVTQRMRAEEGLTQANLVVENSPAMLFRWCAEPGWPVVFVSHNVRQLGYSAEAFLAGEVSFGELLYPDDFERVTAELAGYGRGKVDHFQQEFRIVARDGRVRWVDCRTTAERDEQGEITHYQGIVIDMTERKQAEEALRHVNRRLHMISECNQALIRSADESELLATACQLVVNVGGYHMARVSYLQEGKAGSVVPMASAGFDPEGRELFAGTSSERLHGQDVNAIVLHNRLPCVVQDVIGDTGASFFMVPAAERTPLALCALPLLDEGRAMGVLTIYSSAAGAFDEGELALLTELAEDLAFGIGVLRTRAERTRAERALWQSELKYRELVENTNSIILRWRPDGEISFINDYGLFFFGYQKEDITSRDFRGAILPFEVSDQQLGSAGLAERLADRVSFAHQTREHRRRNGERVWVAWTNKAITDRSGHVVELFSVGSDMTERMRAETALRESEERFARAFHGNPAPMVITDLRNGRILDVNGQVARMFGYTRDEMMGRTALELRVWADPEQYQQLIARLAAEGFVREASARFVTRSGEIREVLWSAEIIRLGDQEALLSLIFDITERKRAEEQLRQYREHLEELIAERTAELQRANGELRQMMAQLVQSEKLAALGNLVAGVAHELNTPLGNVRMVASLLAQQLRSFPATVEASARRPTEMESFLARGREAVDLLERNAARAADLIGHFKQVAVDQSSTRRRRFDLRQTVDEMLITLQPLLKTTLHRIEVDIPAGLVLDSFPGPLEQIIANLVSNSLVHGFAGVEAGRIELRGWPSESAPVIHLRYADDGVGIPATSIKRIFDPFFTTRLGQGGNGLGLYIVYNLVHGVLGGEISVDSTLGQGVCFTLTLPRTAPERPDAP